MTAATARRLVVAAALAVLATTAACGAGGDGGPTPPGPTGTETAGTQENGTGTPGPDETGTTSDPGGSDAQVFLDADNEESTASDIELTRTQVGEPVQEDVEIKASKERPPPPLQDVRGEIKGHEVEIVEGCLGEVPSDGCTVTFRYTPTEPGPYDGELTLTMADGSTVTVPVHGEADEATTSDTGPTTPGPTTPEPVTTDPETPSEHGTPSEDGTGEQQT
ncbi:hypothetical protein [Streptomyces sp. NPDC008240]|uniref:hypothetical protein n=1 Tax=Streptomyces sp. NPDC008240 TaxID=3364822 RepID=UPI0036E04A6A